jgi:hypothetical protein
VIVGPLEIELIATDADVRAGRSDKKCYRVRDAAGFDAIIWSAWGPQRAVGNFIEEFFGLPRWTVEIQEPRRWAAEIRL